MPKRATVACADEGQGAYQVALGCGVDVGSQMLRSLHNASARSASM
jgi:hypothetical protein